MLRFRGFNYAVLRLDRLVSDSTAAEMPLESFYRMQGSRDMREPVVDSHVSRLCHSFRRRKHRPSSRILGQCDRNLT